MENAQTRMAGLADVLTRALGSEIRADDLSGLSERELLVMYARHVEGETWSAIAARYNTNSGHVQRIAQKANHKLGKLRATLRESRLCLFENPNDPPWSKDWQPSPYMLAWFSNLLRVMKDGAIWGVPNSAQVYRIDKKNKTLILIAGDPHDELHWHDKNIKTLAALGWKVAVAVEKEKSAGNLNLQAELGNLIKRPKSGVLFLSTGLGYAVDETDKIMILMRGKPDAAHAQVKAFMQPHGWTVLDDPNDSANPDEMSFAEHVAAKQIRFELLEDAGTPFANTPVTLQYRPFQMDGGWQWAWVLLPDDRSKALGHGQGINRAVAAVAARKEARKLGVTIAKIDVLKPYEKP